MIALFVGYDPAMLFNPLTRYLYSERELPHGTKVNLVPGYFSVGEPRERVFQEVAEAGFKRWAPFGTDPAITDEFERSAGSNMACGYEFFLGFGFDADGGLLKAENQVDGACL